MAHDLIKLARKAGIKKNLTREENDALYQRIIEGDKSAINEMIEGNMGLVVLRVEEHIANYPSAAYLRDDLQGEGLLALTQAVNTLATSGDVERINPNGYLYAAIYSGILACQLRDQYLSGSKISILKELSEGNELATVSYLEDDRNYLIDPMPMYELLDQVRSLPSTELERQLIELLIDGHTLKEAATQLGISYIMAYRLRTKLQERYDEQEAE